MEMIGGHHSEIAKAVCIKNRTNYLKKEMVCDNIKTQR